MKRMTRPTRDRVLIECAESWAARSTCERAQVGVIISREGRTLSTGYNGTPAGMAHCNHECDCGGSPIPDVDFHMGYCLSFTPCTQAVHAEANAVAWAARHGVGLMGAELHTTRVPCLTCAGLIVNAGIVRVTWVEEHRDMAGLHRLGQAGVDVVQWGA